ncbi:MAG TPA: type I-U CRISPR-associated protein Csx17 [Longimicrobiaceae bacterium]|nr:type I-U CRISPR-associated protein Csx17 [Longimicrobiaceae bacterium]
MTELQLAGCTPEPLAAYLKALGVLRLVAEQKDVNARGWWEGERFCIRSTLDEEMLLRFFLEEYAPTPIIAPWNGGSGFFPGDNRSGITAIGGTADERFAPYRIAISTARTMLNALGAETKPGKEEKEQLISRLRDELDERSLAWLDAALVLTEDGLRFPPLLGTGGNDGRLDFTNNQMQRLAELLLETPPETSQALLRGSLFGTPVPGLRGTAIGQFSPVHTGSANTGPGFEGAACVNPWDYVLLFEGALLFAASVTRRLEAARPGALAYPFSVRASGSGYASASDADEARSRHELWLPLWSTPAGLRELRALFGEGRAHVGSRPANTGVDFARAVASLAVDRGITGFTRYGFHVRNGLAYFATPLDRWEVRRNPRVDLLHRIDGWVERLRRAAGDKNAPASVRRAYRTLEEAILALCRDNSPHPVGQVLIALGQIEAVLARSHGFTSHKGIPPVPPLPLAWVRAANDSSPEFRLAAALASVGIREYLVPVRLRQPRKWQSAGDPRVVWGAGELVTNLLTVVTRREVEESRDDEVAPPGAVRYVQLPDIALFIARAVDEDRLAGLLSGLACCDWSRSRAAEATSPPSSGVPFIYSLLKIVHDRQIRPDLCLLRTPGMIARAAGGDAFGATTLAVRRLRGAGLIPCTEAFHTDPERTRRAAAALLFPISPRDRAELVSTIMRPSYTSELSLEAVS